MAAKKKKKKRAARPAPTKKTRKVARRDPLRAMPPSLPRDTPVDTPVVRLPQRSLIEPPPVLAIGDAASALATRPETIEAAYDAWDELRAEAASLKASFAAEHQRLDQQGELLLGAVREATPEGTGSSLVRRTGMQTLGADAQRSLEAARTDLERRAADAQTAISEAISHVFTQLRARVERQAVQAKPLVELMVRVLPGDKRILHVRRPSPDAAVTLLFATSGRVPTRYGYLFDDSTDEALLAPPVLYPDEGVTERRPRPAQLEALLSSKRETWPVKGMIPMLSSFGLVRWLERGAVMEAEVADGDGFRNMLSRHEAEQLTGALLALKLDGRIELELVRG
ncbi:MAG: hypothetical protein Q8S33_14745 [Myxococcales bacterium]|nr:hypothetical protein [Myxococcales bacterium]